MITLRIFINNEDCINNKWQIFNAGEISGDGHSSSFSEMLSFEHESIEIYLAPHLANVFKIDIEHISDRKINDELLLGLVENNIVDEIDDCKPILLRLSDGDSYIAIVGADFHKLLIEHLSEHIKKVKFIQPMPYVTEYQDELWTVYLDDDFKFIRTSLYEYYLLDDSNDIPVLLDEILQTYEQKEILLYCNNQDIVNNIENTYDIKCNLQSELNYGAFVWNFYNEKTKKFNLKLNEGNKHQILKIAKYLSIIAIVYFIIWFIQLFYLIGSKYSLESDINKNLSGIIKVSDKQSNHLSLLNNELDGLLHSKGMYSQNDFVSLFAIFLYNVPGVGQNSVVGLTYSGNVLNVILNSQFNRKNFDQVREILMTKQVLSSITDYQTYQNAQQQNTSNNNGGGILDSDNSSDKQQIEDASWVISLQTLTNLDALNVANNKKTK